MYERIKELCVKHGITIKALERELKLGNGSIGKWRVSSPSAAKLGMVADYFGVSVDYLLKGN